MIGLKIYLTLKDGMDQGLIDAYKNSFQPAIKVQEGFRNVMLLKKQDSLCTFQINLFFDTEEQRQAWVATDAHQAAWPKIAANCVNAEWVLFDITE